MGLGSRTQCSSFDQREAPRNETMGKGRFVMTAKQMIVAGLFAAGLMLAGNSVYAAGQYGPGVTDT